MRTHDMEKVTRNLSILVAASNQPNVGNMGKVWIQSGKCRPKYARPFLFSIMVIHAAENGVNETQDIVRS